MTNIREELIEHVKAAIDSAEDPKQALHAILARLEAWKDTTKDAVKETVAKAKKVEDHGPTSSHQAPGSHPGKSTSGRGG